MGTLLKICLTATLLSSYVLLTWSLETENVKDFQTLSMSSNNIEARRNTTAADNRRQRTVAPKKKVKKTKTKGVSRETGRDVNCTTLGGICQSNRYICQGRYLNNKCPGGKTQQCCLPDGAWSVLCAGHHNNRVRACDAYGCGAFNSRRGSKLHKAVDIVCDDYGVINAPFSGSLAGPVSHMDPSGIQYEGVKLVSKVHCVKLFNMRPYRFMGPVSKGEAVGYLLPLQDSFSGITSHLRLETCDGSDPTSFI